MPETDAAAVAPPDVPAQIADPQALRQEWYKALRIVHHSHYAAAKRYQLYRLILGLPTIILSAVAGTTLFSTLEGSGDTRLKIITGLIVLLVAVLSSLQTFLNFGERSERHKAAATHYGALRRRVEFFLMEPDAGGEQEFWKGIMDDWNLIEKEAPKIPNRLYADAKQAARLA